MADVTARCGPLYAQGRTREGVRTTCMHAPGQHVLSSSYRGQGDAVARFCPTLIPTLGPHPNRPYGHVNLFTCEQITIPQRYDKAAALPGNHDALFLAITLLLASKPTCTSGQVLVVSTSRY
jgi:hypothetical protein